VRRRASAITIPKTNPAQSLEFAKDHLFERVSVSADYDILAEALRHGRGHTDHVALKGVLAFQEAFGKILRNGKEIATRKSLERETAMVESVNREIGAFGRLGGMNPFTASDRLSPEQRRVVEVVLDSHDGAMNISGAAGTGKTATLQELRRGLSDGGREILAVAPTVSAVKELQRVGFGEAMTLERLLQDRQSQASLSRKVLIVDEAGMVSGRQMSELLQLAEEHSARIVFSGDTKQMQSVESCDALRVLEKESRLKTVALTEVRRQTSERYKEAIQMLRSDPELGFEKLDAMRAVREVAWVDRPRAVAPAFADLKSQGHEPLVVCATHEEIERVTEAIRLSRKMRGELGTGMQMARMVSLNWTNAQKSDIRNLRAGHVLSFHRAVKGIAKNEMAEVVIVNGSRAMIRVAQGDLRTITGKQAKSYDVQEKKTIEVSAGDKLLLTANRRERSFHATNGEIVTVAKIDHQGRILLRDGRLLPGNFRQFTYGYAVTAHRSQGKSVDSVIISADGMRKKLFYVAASRGRKNIAIVTSNREELRESVGRSAARQSATELARKQRPGLHQGIGRGLATARRLAAWAAQHLSSTLRIRRQQLVECFGNKQAKERSHDHGLSR
jgi:ATP-dependent exoDNAse (exonuclease V) alpha subunit